MEAIGTYSFEVKRSGLWFYLPHITKRAFSYNLQSGTQNTGKEGAAFQYIQLPFQKIKKKNHYFNFLLITSVHESQENISIYIHTHMFV